MPLSETKDELDAVADSHGWSLEGITIIELSQVEQTLTAKSQNTLFQTAEVELGNLSRLITGEFDRVEPARMVLDSLSEMRLMSQSALRYRREILRLKQHFASRGCTVLLLDDRSHSAQEARGAMKKAVSVIKKRTGSHEDTIRELTLSGSGIRIGRPLVDFEGVMTGVPRVLGGQLEPAAGARKPRTAHEGHRRQPQRG